MTLALASVEVGIGKIMTHHPVFHSVIREETAEDERERARTGPHIPRDRETREEKEVPEPQIRPFTPYPVTKINPR
jgi:hypothetical protein